MWLNMRPAIHIVRIQGTIDFKSLYGLSSSNTYQASSLQAREAMVT